MSTESLKIVIPNEPSKSLPASLESRLNGSPVKSPEDLASELAKHSERTAFLRQAHLDAIKDRAARDKQRVADAAARKLRLAAAHVAKVQRRLDAADVKVSAKKERDASAVNNLRARRDEMARRVKAARDRSAERREIRAKALLEAESLAFTKRAKAVQATVDKSAWQVKHAVAVVAAKKEAAALAASTACERLASRLEAAETRRIEVRTPTKVHDGAVRGRVLNESKVASEMQAALTSAAQERAASKREAILASVAAKASAVVANAADKAAALKNKAAGTDATTASAKAALFEKMNRAEVHRLHGLKEKLRFAGKAKGDTTSVIVVRIEHAAPRMPPAALVKRLATAPRALLASAAARQAGAKSRRAGLRAAALLRAANFDAKLAAAAGRRAAAKAALEAAVGAKHARALVCKAIREGEKAYGVAKQQKRHGAAVARRHALAEKLAAKGRADADKADGAAERRASKVRATAKAGVAKVRLAATKARRDAKATAVVARFTELAERAAAASATKAARMAHRVAVAKRMATPRGKAPKESEC